MQCSHTELDPGKTLSHATSSRSRRIRRKNSWLRADHHPQSTTRNAAASESKGSTFRMSCAQWLWLSANLRSRNWGPWPFWKIQSCWFQIITTRKLQHPDTFSECLSQSVYKYTVYMAFGHSPSSLLALNVVSGFCLSGWSRLSTGTGGSQPPMAWAWNLRVKLSWFGSVSSTGSWTGSRCSWKRPPKA